MSHSDRLPPCPKSPNCVCSDDGERDSFIEPLDASANPAACFAALYELLSEMPGITIVSHDPERIVATATSRLLRFVDDLEFQLRPGEGVIAMRSASRKGYWDLGANRHRLERIRQQIEDQL